MVYFLKIDIYNIYNYICYGECILITLFYCAGGLCDKGFSRRSDYVQWTSSSLALRTPKHDLAPMDAIIFGFHFSA